MPTYEVTSPTGKKLRITGDTPPNQQQLDEIFSQYDIKPERSFSEKAVGFGEAALGAITSAAAEPIAGIAGLARAATQGAEAGGERVEEMKQRLSYQPTTEAGKEYTQAIGELPVLKQIGETMQGASKYAGEKTFDITGSPTAAAIAEGIPAAAATGLGAKAPGGLASRLETRSQMLANDANKVSASATAAINADKPVAGVASGAIKTLNPQKLMDIADVDPKFYKAMDKIGVTAEPLASYASRNPQFIGLEQGLAAIPASSLSIAEKAFIKDLSGAAQGIFEKYGASVDSAAKSMDWRDASMKSIDELGVASGRAYDAIAETLDKRQPAAPTETMKFLDEVTKDLPAGIDDPDVPTALKKAYNSIQARQIANEAGGVDLIPANYESMDRLRKNIGAAAFKREGDFKDADSAILKRLYGSLTDDLNTMAEAQGAIEQVKLGKSLVAQRKRLEDQMQTLLGKDLNKDIVPVVMGDLKKLASGGLKKYTNTMQQINDPLVRQELVMTSLNDMFTKTRAGKEQFTPTDYIKWYNSTLKKTAIRDLLAKDMPKGALKKLDALARISEGMATAKAQKIPTGVVNSLLDDKAGMVRRMVGKGVRLVPHGGAITAAVSDVLKGSTKRSQQAGDLLASPELAYVIRQGVAQGVATGTKASKMLQKAEASLSSSDRYKRWANTLTAGEKAKLASAGITSFLIGQQPDDTMEKTKPAKGN